MIRRSLMPGTDTPAPKRFRDGTHRLVAPAETVARVRRCMPAMGITRIADVTGLDCIGIPVVMVCRPNSRAIAVSQGKGLDRPAAEASGLMESVEAFHAERITRPLLLGRYADLRTSTAIVDVEHLPRVAGGRFHADLPLLWIKGHDLAQGGPAWVPYEMVHTDYTLPLPTGSGCFAASSSGLASGNHLLEAISHAVCEVVERDAVSLWTRGGVETEWRTRVDPGTVDDHDCRRVLEIYDRAGVDVAVWETTADIDIPSFYCTITERTDDPLRMLYAAGGSGCHPARHIALMRALTEAAQSRLTMIAGSRDDLYRSTYRTSRDPDLLRRFRDQLASPGPLRSFRDAPTFEGDSFDADVEWELARLRGAGFDSVVAVDLTMPEFRLPVVRVIVPGLEATDESPDYVPGPRAQRLLRTCAVVPTGPSEAVMGVPTLHIAEAQR
jgi:YcaO-like protein with predicted kinase domain